MYQISLALLLVIPNLSLAQDYCKYKKSNLGINIEDIGVFASINRVNIIDSYEDCIFPNSEHYGMTSTALGISIKKDIKHTNFLKIELSYIQKGSSYRLKSNSSLKNLKLNYIEIPVLWGYRFKKQNPKYYFESGLAIAKLIGSFNSIEELTTINPKGHDQNFKDFDVSLILSVKRTLNPQGRKNILLGFKFSNSILSIYHNYSYVNTIYGFQLDYIFKKRYSNRIY